MSGSVARLVGAIGVSATCMCVALSAACGRSAERPTSAAFRPLGVGDTVPHFEVIGLAGDTTRIGGRAPVTLVNVWATWCESCREEMQELDSLYHDFRPQGLRVVAISVDEGDGSRVRRFVDAERLTLPIAHDPTGLVSQRLSTVGVPESYLIDSTGRLTWLQVGGLHGDVGAARTAVSRVLKR
jgi:peroxiredoxin